MFIILSLITYPVLFILGQLFWPLTLVIILALLYFAVKLNTKWSSADMLRDPFSSPQNNIAAKQTNNRVNSTSQLSAISSVSEDAFFTILKLEGIDRARTIYLQAIQHAPDEPVFQETSLSKLAYDELKKGNTELAIDLFTLNTEAFPRSANCHASLADAYRSIRNTNEAISYYKKALELLVIDRSKNELFRQSLLANIKDNLRRLSSEG